MMVPWRCCCCCCRRRIQNGCHIQHPLPQPTHPTHPQRQTSHKQHTTIHTPTCVRMVLLRGSIMNTVHGHTAPSSRAEARQLSLSALLLALAAATMAACEPRKARPPCSFAALYSKRQHRGKGIGSVTPHTRTLARVTFNQSCTHTPEVVLEVIWPRNASSSRATTCPYTHLLYMWGKNA